MDAKELKQKLEAHEEIKILDIREADEFNSGEPIPGSENMPMGKVFVEASKGNLPKDEKIVMVCRSGGRCNIVTKELHDGGYDIEVLEGGINAWKSLSEN